MTAPAGAAPKVGELARLTAALLADAGLRVTDPDPADAGRVRLVIASRAAQCVLMISDRAKAELRWSPFSAEAADPHRVADLAATLLSGQAAARHPDTAASGHLTFKGIVGMDLRASRSKVDMNVYTDDYYYYDMTAEITITDPRAGHSAAVYVTDDGWLTWHRDYWDEHAETAWQPGFRTRLPDPPAVALAIADDVSRALSTGHAVLAAC